MDSPTFLKTKSQRRRARSTQPPVLRLVTRRPRLAKNKDLTLLKEPELMVTTRSCAPGYQRTSVMNGDQQSARPNALLSSAEEFATYWPMNISLLQRLAAPTPDSTALGRAESEYGREKLGQS